VNRKESPIGLEDENEEKTTHNMLHISNRQNFNQIRLLTIDTNRSDEVF
jgi:hypothetical protein